MDVNKVVYIATGGGGLGNQIKKLISAKRLHSDSKTDISYFRDLFKRTDLYHHGNRYGKDMCTWRFLVLPCDSEIKKGFNRHTIGNEIIGNGFTWYDPYSDWSVNKDGRNVDCEYLRIPTEYTNKILKVIDEYFTIHDDIKIKVDEFIKAHPKFSTVHLRSYNSDDFVKNGPNRRGDSNPRAKARHSYYLSKQKNKIINYINNLTEELIYVSSDNRNELNDIKILCPTKKIITYTELYGKAFSSDYSNDFLDMVLLSKGIEMVLCRISTFSEVAWYFSKCNKNIFLY